MYSKRHHVTFYEKGKVICPIASFSEINISLKPKNRLKHDDHHRHRGKSMTEVIKLHLLYRRWDTHKQTQIQINIIRGVLEF